VQADGTGAHKFTGTGQSIVVSKENVQNGSSAETQGVMKCCRG
jgi:hypothetical protein